jgi:hypothetical protein
MACLDCKGYKTVGDMFSTNIKTLNIDIECSKKLPTFNKAMAHLWSYSFLLPWFKVSESIDPQAVTHKTCERIYMPYWFFWEWCSPCLKTDEQCWSCQNWYKEIDMRYMESVPYIGQAQYTIRCPLSNDVEYSMPSWINNAYFTYYRYFDRLEDMNSLVKIPDFLEPALDMLVAYHSPWIDPADKVSLWEDFVNYIKQQYEVFKLSKQMQSRILPTLFK